MSRQTVAVEGVCEFIELEEFYSTGRGELHLTYVCHHPEHDGCLCVLDGATVAECERGKEVGEEKSIQL